MTTDIPKEPPSKFARLTKQLGILTAALIAVAALINSAGDVVNAVKNVPLTFEEKQDHTLFQAHFKELPIHNTDIPIKIKNSTISMLLEVYGNGDIFVSYAGNEKWFPFAMEEPHASSFLPSVSVAYASSSAADGKTEMIKPNTIKIDSYKRQPVIDIGKIIQIQNQAEAENKIKPKPTINKSYLLAEVNDDHSSFLSSSKKVYTKAFHAEPGYAFKSYNIRITSLNNARILDSSKSDSVLTVKYEIESGPAIDRWRGWIKAEIQTVQELLQ